MRNIRREKRESNVLVILLGIMMLMSLSALALSQKPNKNIKPQLIMEPSPILKPF